MRLRATGERGERGERAERGEDRVLVWAILASQVGPPFMFSGVAVALPALGADLDAGAASLALIETTFLAGSTAFLLPIGRIADAMDKGTLFKTSLLAFGLLSALLGVLSWLPAILLVRILQGVASAGFAATGTALLADLVPPARRGAVFGASMGAVYAGLLLGPLAAGVLVRIAGWRAVFLVGAAVILLGFAIVAPRLRATWRAPRRVVHAPSAWLLATAVACAVAGSAALRTGVVGVALLAAAVLLAAAFVALQYRLDRPLLEVRVVFARTRLGAALAVQLLLYLNAFCAVFVLSLFLQLVLRQTPAAAGLVLASGTALMAAVAPFAGALADRLRAERVAAAGAAFVLLSSLLGMRLHAASSPADVLVVVLAQGLGFGLFSSPNMALVMDGLPGRTGTASALAAKSRSVGMVAGMVATAALLSLDFGDAPVAAHPERFPGTATAVFGVLAVTSALALLLCLLRGRR